MSIDVLVVAPHPDDETLGCGGTILHHVDQGDRVHWLIMTRITTEMGFSLERVNERSIEIENVASSYGFSSVHKADFATTQLDQYSKKELISVVSKVITLLQPEIIYVPFRNDVHSDHEAVFDAVASCSKSFRYPFIKNLRAYETLSETEFSIRPANESHFTPNLWIDVSRFIEKKIEIMEMYKGEMGKHPFPRSEKNIRALSTFRGAFAGVEAAEAFMNLIEIVK
ncbi:MAG: PIG-L family deacetylase [Desulfamplus sp.]|nr:PIG-L family deacetylase [Desulfamplus sp.]